MIKSEDMDTTLTRTIDDVYRQFGELWADGEPIRTRSELAAAVRAAKVDLTEINHSPITRPPQAQTNQQLVTALKQQIETLQTELAEMKIIATGYRGDFERECERTNKLLAELLKATTDTMGAREKAALLEGKLSMLTQPWRRRLVDAFTLALPQVASSPRESAAPSPN